MKIKRTAHYMAQANIGDTHEILNVSMIIMLCKIYNDVVVHAPHDCNENLRKQLDLQGCDIFNLKFVNSKILLSQKNLFWLICFLQSSATIIRKSKDVYFFSTLNFNFFPLQNLLCKLTGAEMYTLCHNDMEHLIKPFWGKFNLHWRMINYIFKKMKFAPNNHCLLLGQSIMHNMEHIVSDDTLHHCFAVCHPYYGNKIKSEDRKTDDVIKIGIAGMLKGADLKSLMEMDSVLDKYPNIKIYLISKTACDLSSLKNLVNLNPTGKHLVRADYDSCLSGMDILYYPYTKDSYKLSASGAVYESIVKHIPFLSFSNDYFKWLNNEFGQLGFLYNEVSELPEIFEKLSDERTLNVIRENSIAAANIIHPDNYYNKFQQILHLK